MTIEITTPRGTNPIPTKINHAASRSPISYAIRLAITIALHVRPRLFEDVVTARTRWLRGQLVNAAVAGGLLVAAL